jgi:transmembrane sensor
MNPTPPEDPASAELHEQQAATWVLRTDRGLTAAEQDEFLQWLVADPRHGTALARHKRNWDRLNRLGQWLPEHSLQPNRDLLAPQVRPRFRIQSARPAWLMPLGLAAALVLGAVTFWPRHSAPVAAPLAVPSISSRTLEDGSVVQLNRGAVVNVLYTPGERRVQLEHGEAHFTVAKDPGRPFVVSAGGVGVRAVGTAFNVKLDTAAVDVLVTEGVVQVAKPVGPPLAGVPSGVSTSDSPTILNVGEHTRISLTEPERTPEVATVTQEQAEAILAWQPRMLDFTALPLAGIVGEFNRHNAPIRIVIADSVLARTEVSASLRSDNVEGFIRLLEAGFGVRAERAGDTITLRATP